MVKMFSRRNLLIMAGALAIGGGAFLFGRDLPGKDNQSIVEHRVKPWQEYGTQLARMKTGSNNRIYVVAMRHRRPFDKKADKDVGKVQAEVYRVAEDLIVNHDVSLMLSEWARYEPPLDNSVLRQYVNDVLNDARISLSRNIDDKSLEKILQDDSLVREKPAMDMCAEALLLINYRTDLQGIEDMKVRGIDHELVMDPKKYDEKLFDHISKFRNAAMLQNAPKVIERELEAGRTANKNAVVLVGQLHMQHMMDSVGNGRVVVPELPSYGLPAVDEELNVKKLGYDITFISPKSLMSYWKKFPR